MAGSIVAPQHELDVGPAIGTHFMDGFLINSLREQKRK